MSSWRVSPQVLLISWRTGHNMHCSTDKLATLACPSAPCLPTPQQPLFHKCLVAQGLKCRQSPACIHIVAQTPKRRYDSAAILSYQRAALQVKPVEGLWPHHPLLCLRRWAPEHHNSASLRSRKVNKRKAEVQTSVVGPNVLEAKDYKHTSGITASTL